MHNHRHKLQRSPCKNVTVLCKLIDSMQHIVILHSTTLNTFICHFWYPCLDTLFSNVHILVEHFHVLSNLTNYRHMVYTLPYLNLLEKAKYKHIGLMLTMVKSHRTCFLLKNNKRLRQNVSLISFIMYYLDQN